MPKVFWPPDPDRHTLGPCTETPCTSDAVAYVHRSPASGGRITFITGPRALAIAGTPSTAYQTALVCHGHAVALLDNLLKED
jgi:hypothetical protein